jgi:mono/diheme cytochrome c family protein
VTRLMKIMVVCGMTLVTGVAGVAAIATRADAQADSADVGAGRKLAKTQCAQCHGVDADARSANPAAPTFETIANVPGMTATALTVALRTSHRSMPNLIIQPRDADNIIAYILSLKRNP